MTHHSVQSLQIVTSVPIYENVFNEIFVLNKLTHAVVLGAITHPFPYFNGSLYKPQFSL